MENTFDIEHQKTLETDEISLKLKFGASADREVREGPITSFLKWKNFFHKKHLLQRKSKT